MTGRVYGTAGGSLTGSPSWVSDAGAARNGAAGERRTAAVLARVAAQTGVTVLHDLNVPAKGYTANIDHVVVSGRKVLVVDSKQWRPGFYWTAGGRTRRGVEAFLPADKQTMGMIFDRLGRYLGGQASLAVPLVVVWPSRADGDVSVWAARMRGARLVPAGRLEPAVRRFARAGAAGDPAVVARLAALLN